MALVLEGLDHVNYAFVVLALFFVLFLTLFFLLRWRVVRLLVIGCVLPFILVLEVKNLNLVCVYELVVSFLALYDLHCIGLIVVTPISTGHLFFIRHK